MRVSLKVLLGTSLNATNLREPAVRNITTSAGMQSTQHVLQCHVLQPKRAIEFVTSDCVSLCAGELYPQGT